MRTASNMRFLEPREALSPTGVWPTLTEPTIQKMKLVVVAAMEALDTRWDYFFLILVITHACMHPHNNSSRCCKMKSVFRFLLDIVMLAQYAEQALWNCRASVRLCIRPSLLHAPHATVAGLLLWAQRPWDIDRHLQVWRSAANTSSATLSADVGS